MKKVIKIKDKTYFLKFDDFDENVDVDSLLKIDYGNLLGELVTFPVVVNRFGVLLADAECIGYVLHHLWMLETVFSNL